MTNEPKKSYCTCKHDRLYASCKDWSCRCSKHSGWKEMDTPLSRGGKSASIEAVSEEEKCECHCHTKPLQNTPCRCDVCLKGCQHCLKENETEHSCDCSFPEYHNQPQKEVKEASCEEEMKKAFGLPVVLDKTMNPGEWRLEDGEIRSNPPQDEGKDLLEWERKLEKLQNDLIRSSRMLQSMYTPFNIVDAEKCVSFWKQEIKNFIEKLLAAQRKRDAEILNEFWHPDRPFLGDDYKKIRAEVNDTITNASKAILNQNNHD